MRARELTLPELAVIAGTRGMLGVGIGLLLAGRLGSARRLRVGRALAIVGAASTIPIALRVFRKPTPTHSLTDVPL